MENGNLGKEPNVGDAKQFEPLDADETTTQ